MAKAKIKIKDEKAGKGKTNPHILGARITEKTAIGSDKGIYTFNIPTTSNKTEVKKAIKAMYDVTPIKIAITKITKKTVMRGGIIGSKSGGKKAVVHLKKGDKITFV